MIHTILKRPSRRPLLHSDDGAPVLESKSQQNLGVRPLVSGRQVSQEAEWRTKQVTIRSSTSRNMPTNMSENSLCLSSATLFHFAIDDGIYFIHVKNSTRYLPGYAYSPDMSANAFTFMTVGSSIDETVGRSYTTDSNVDAAALQLEINRC